jgi:hypothetical protein
VLWEHEVVGSNPTTPTTILPGSYTVRLTLEDVAQGVRADRAAIVFVVEAPEEAAATGAVPGLTQVLQAAGEGQVSLSVPGVVLVVGHVLGGLFIGLLVLILRRRRRTRSTEQ